MNLGFPNGTVKGKLRIHLEKCNREEKKILEMDGKC